MYFIAWNCRYTRNRRADTTRKLGLERRLPESADESSRAGVDAPGDTRDDVDPATGAIEPHLAVDQRENGVIATEPDILAGQKFRAALADDDVAGDDRFAAKFFHAEPFADAVAAVLDAALSFFMSHWEVESWRSLRATTRSLFGRGLLGFAPRLMPVILTRVSLRR